MTAARTKTRTTYTRHELNLMRSEILKGMTLEPKTESDKSWDRATKRAVRIIDTHLDSKREELHG